MRVVRIKTTAYEEEDFFLLTTLLDDEIADVIQPIVDAERNGNKEYDNDDIVKSLMDKYPNNKIEMIIEFDELVF